MAVKPYILPVCDKCGRPWLPDGWEPESDPRVIERLRREKGQPPLRCGYCKQAGWDKNFVGDRRLKGNR
jgi:hypothetical protein